MDEKPEIKVVLFDFDGVLFPKGHFSEPFQKAIKKAGTNFIEKPKSFDRYKLLEDSLTGKITLEQQFQKVAEIYNLDFKYFWSEFLKNYKNKQINPKLIELILELKQKNFKVGILTDSSDFFNTFTIPHFKLNKIFDYIFNSWDLQLSKNSQTLNIYKKIIPQTGVKAENILFIDDKSENITTAKKAGITGIVFKNVNQLKKSISKFIA